MKEDFPENDALWSLLGKASRPGVTPFFARNVLRTIRQSEPSKPTWFLPRWLAPIAFAAIIAGFAFSLENTPLPHAAPRNPPELAEYFDALIDQFDPAVDFTPAHLAGF